MKFSNFSGRRGNVVKGKGEVQSRGVIQNRGVVQNRGTRANGAVRGRKNGGITDARFKIIQKNRQKLTDARDKLVEIAKQSDARLKLDKLRATHLKKIDPFLGISRKTGRNGKISLSTNKISQFNAINQSAPTSYITPSTRTVGFRPPLEPHYVDNIRMDFNDGMQFIPKKKTYKIVKNVNLLIFFNLNYIYNLLTLYSCFLLVVCFLF